MLIIVFLEVKRGKFVPLLRGIGSVFANNRVCSSHFHRGEGRREVGGGGRRGGGGRGRRGGRRQGAEEEEVGKR